MEQQQDSKAEEVTQEQQPRILVVDDEPIALELAQMSLQRAGYEPVTARGGIEGLDRARQWRPDLMLLDVTMPDMDGFEVFRQLRDDEETATIPVIFVTARDDVEHRKQGLGLGAIDYVTKPYSPSELVARVAITLRLQRLERVVREREVEQERRKAVEALLITVSHYINNAAGAIQGRAEITDEHNPESVRKLREVTLRQIGVIKATIASIEELLGELQVRTSSYATGDAQMLDIENMVRRRIERAAQEYNRGEHDE